MRKQIHILSVFIICSSILIGCTSNKNDDLNYKISINESLGAILKDSSRVSPEKMADIIYNNNTQFRLIDIRNPNDYIKGHVPGAINIPGHDILNPQYKKYLNQDDVINILYCHSAMKATEAWFLLFQLGYKNNLYFHGGYHYIKENILDAYKVNSSMGYDEKEKYDYNAIMKSLGAKSSGTSSSISAPALNAPITKKKKAVQGGC